MEKNKDREEPGEKRKVIIHNGKYDSDEKTSPAKPISMRGRSLSFSLPTYRDNFSSLPESPATKFLAEFSYKDDFYNVPEFEEGTVINNYVIGQILGGGVYSECREAYVLNNRELNGSNIPDKVALKVITDPRYMHTFKKELMIWSRLKHPNILPLIDSFSGEGYMVAVSVLAEQGNLHSYVSKNGKMPEEMARRLFKQIVSAVHYLHEIEKIVHLDIKLENILLRKNYDIYLCDFGTSSKFSDSFMEEISNEIDNNSQFCSGSVTSLPPEIFSSSTSSLKSTSTESFNMKKRQDMWALGICFYAMMTGRLPFSDDFLPRLQHSIVAGEYKPIDQSVSDEVRSIISKLLSKTPEERPNIQELLDKMETLEKKKI